MLFRVFFLLVFLRETEAGLGPRCFLPGNLRLLDGIEGMTFLLGRCGVLEFLRGEEARRLGESEALVERAECRDERDAHDDAPY